MSAIKQIVSESRRRSDVDEFLQYELTRAGYGGVEITKTPIGTRLTIYAVRPSMVIGRGGEGIRYLAKKLEDNYKLFNPQIAVAEVPVPEFNPKIMGAKIASALERGIHFRRACHWALTNIMNAGAQGAEIVLSGKLTTERSRREKFKAGFMPKVGDSAMKDVNRAVVYTQLKPGLFGIRVTIVPTTYKSPDRITVKEVAEVAPPIEEVALETVGEGEAEVKTPEDVSTTPAPEVVAGTGNAHPQPAEEPSP
ncbi:MAG: 30S ribosomal protein S3 [Candidatus Bathyarchaeia archaeon]